MRLLVLALSISLAAVSQSHAQSRSQNLEEIVVTGYRLSQQRAIDRKREAAALLDAVGTDELGQLPDKNAAEAIDRLPGVSITFDQGEGRFVLIRGINPTLNNLTINGIGAGSPEADNGGRLAPLDVIGGDLLEAIEVVKARTPDMPGQGIGGAINVVTPMPFDQEQSLFGFGSARLGYEEMSGNTPYSGTFRAGGIDEAQTWGWLVSGSYDYRDYQSRGYFPDDWRVIDFNGQQTRAPENAKNNFYQLERTRTAASAVLQFRPTDTSEYFARAYFSRFEEDEERQRFEYLFSRDVTAITADGGVSGTNNRREQDLRLEQKNKEFFNVAIGGKNQLNDSWAIDYSLQYNDNQQTEPNRNWEFRGDDYGPDRWTINGDGFVSVVSGAQDGLDPSVLRFRRIRNQDNRTDETALIGDFNASVELATANPTRLQFGLRATQTERDNDGRRVRYNLGSTDWFVSDFGHFGGTFTNEVDDTPFPGMIVDPGAANQFFNANFNNTEFFELDAGDTFDSEFQSDYNIDEDIVAAYAMAEVEIGKAALIGGVRIEQTDVTARGFTRDEDNQSALPISQDGSYTSVLPTLIVNYSLTDNLLLRAAYTRALGRPNYNQIAPISALSRDGSDAELFIGNPELQARVADNYDLALEYYLPRSGIASVGLFYKEMDDFIVSRTETFTNFTFNGETFDRFDRRTFENADKARLQGAEARFDYYFDNLPGLFNGFGVSINYALIDSDLFVEGRGDFPLTQQPDWTRGITLLYQSGPLEAALSYDERDEYLDSIEGSPETDLFIDKFGRLDFRASYELTERMQLFFEWLNINDEPIVEFQGGDLFQVTGYEHYEQTWYVGLSARL